MNEGYMGQFPVAVFCLVSFVFSLHLRTDFVIIFVHLSLPL